MLESSSINNVLYIIVYMAESRQPKWKYYNKTGKNKSKYITFRPIPYQFSTDFRNDEKEHDGTNFTLSFSQVNEVNIKQG